MGKPSILYIEDYPVVQKIYIDVLTNEGFDVTVAKDGKEATEKTKNGQFDVLLVDLLLPTTSGLEFLQSYRNEHPKEHDKSLIIVLTDFDDEHSVEKVKNLGIEHYWIKVEHTPHKIAEKIQKLLGVEPQKKEAA